MSTPAATIPAYSISLDAPEHAAAVEALYDDVFGPGRFAKTAERLREGNTKIADASLVAIDSEGLTGVVRVWPVTVGETGRAAFLGPIAVAERRRGNGVAFKLMERAIGVCREQGYAAVILVGAAVCSCAGADGAVTGAEATAAAGSVVSAPAESAAIMVAQRPTCRMADERTESERIFITGLS